MLYSKCKKIISTLTTAVLVTSNAAMLPADASLIEAEPNEAQSTICDHEPDGNEQGVKIALLDAGTTKYQTSESISFVNDDTVNSDHGDKMLGILNDKVPEAEILDVRVLDDNGIGTYTNVSKGIRWAVDNNANIIVMSFAGYKNSSLLCDAVEYAEKHNVFVVASAGNTYSEKAAFPAAFDTVVSVGATDENGSITDYSNYGEYVDMYEESADGTSCAAQLAAVSAAKRIEAEPAISAAELRKEFQWNEKKHISRTSEENSEEFVYAACNHDFENWRITQQPTCTKTGTKVRTCKKYGCRKQETKSIPKKAHTCAWKPGKASTCTMSGTEEYRCTKCGYVSKTRTKAALKHDFENWRVTQKATCTKAGTKARTCRRTGCHKEEKVTIPITHEYDSWRVTKKATCKETGTLTRTCKKYGCKHKETQTISKKEHNYSWQSGRTPTCTLDGTRELRCSGCNKVKDTKPLKAPGHDYEKWRVSKAATCTKEGVQTRICKKCHKEEKKAIAKSKHSYSWVTKDPTCTADGYKKKTCKNCKHVANTQKLPKLDHLYGKWESIIPATCEKDGKQERICQRYGCFHKDTKVIKRTGHNWTYRIEKDIPDLYKGGKKIEYCTKCSAKGKSIPIPAVDYTSTPNGNTIPFSFDYKGEAVSKGKGVDSVTTYNGKKVFVMTFKANYDWSLATPDYVNVHDASTKKAIRNGKAKTKYKLYVWLNANANDDIALNSTYTQGQGYTLMSFRVQGASIPFYFDHSFTVNGKPAYTYFKQEVLAVIKKIHKSDELTDYLCGHKSTGNAIKILDYDATKKIAIFTDNSNKNDLHINYMIFKCGDNHANKKIDGRVCDQIDLTISLYQTYGMTLRQDKGKPIITTKNTIDNAYINITDTDYEKALKKAGMKNDAVIFLKNACLSYLLPGEEIATVIGTTVLGNFTDDIITNLNNTYFEATHVNNGKNAIIINSSLALHKNCEMGEKDEGKFIEATCYSVNGNLVNEVAFHFDIKDSYGHTYKYDQVTT
ncbi:S8 family serine peptidase [uncultured Ruminococcus sp.]|uniref:S8 family peptidase n=1 Tax=uncultured Ruminococcus sp. TaxID=165186 RepID=UPI00262F4173|nr:S8 family serine peptidase [uncultured Ruminococcus sp.]